jgi:hypothetical protein
MPYLIGSILALLAATLAAAVGLDRGRAFYPTVLIVIATYYVLFAVMGGSSQVLVSEIAVATGFTLVARHRLQVEFMDCRSRPCWSWRLRFRSSSDDSKSWRTGLVAGFLPRV